MEPGTWRWVTMPVQDLSRTRSSPSGCHCAREQLDVGAIMDLGGSLAVGDSGCRFSSSPSPGPAYPRMLHRSRPFSTHPDRAAATDAGWVMEGQGISREEPSVEACGILVSGRNGTHPQVWSFHIARGLQEDSAERSAHSVALRVSPRTPHGGRLGRTRNGERTLWIPGFCKS